MEEAEWEQNENILEEPQPMPTPEEDRETEQEGNREAYNAFSAEEEGRAELEREGDGEEKGVLEHQTAQGTDEAIAALGMTNPFTGKPIANAQDLRDFQTLRGELQRGGMYAGSPKQNGIQRPYQALPETQMVKTALERLGKQRICEQIERDIQEISRFDPSVKKAEDLRTRPEYQELCRMVGQGYTLSDAWKLKNMDAISRRGAEAARQSALNSVMGKGHLAASTSRGTGNVPVPAEVAEQYRMLMPDITNAEIQRDYNEYVKSMRRNHEDR